MDLPWVSETKAVSDILHENVVFELRQINSSVLFYTVTISWLKTVIKKMPFWKKCKVVMRLSRYDEFPGICLIRTKFCVKCRLGKIKHLTPQPLQADTLCKNSIL